MVFFNCNACGEAIKKNQVEKHYRQQCRNCQVLSCVDCGKEFWGDEYAKHIKCITEDEKFGGKAYKPKPNANKGEQKQELWVQQVQDAISKLKANPKLKDLLERLKDYPNIPRKQAKFENFLYNSLRVMDRNLATQAWNSIAVEMSNSSTSEPPANVPAAPAHKKDGGEKVAEEIKTEVAIETQNGHTLEKKKKKKRDKEEESEIANGNCKEKLETDHPQRTVDDDDADAGKDGRKKMRKKRKRDEEEVVEEEDEASMKKRSKSHDEKEEEKVEAEDANIPEESPDEAPTGKFKWEAAIVGVLRRADDKEMTVKKLRKKVLGEFHARGGDGKHYTEERLLAKFTKKINKNRRLKVHKDTVKLVS